MQKSKKQLTFTVLILALALVVTSASVFARPSVLGVSPTLNALLDFSVLGGVAVTNTGPTTTEGAVGVSPGSSITGFGGAPNGTAGGGLHINDTEAIAAQAEAGTVFTSLDQTCDVDLGAGLVELGGMTLVPGVYCAGSFQVTGDLTLTGGADEVYIFKSASTIVMAEGARVLGGDPCNVWWRAVSNVTMNAGSSLVGYVFSAGASDSAMKTNASLSGKFIGLEEVTITLQSNTITEPVCLVAEVPTEEATAGPETLPDTGGDQDGLVGSQIVQISLGALGLSLILFGVMLNRRTQKVER